jgi:hypothetical protein
MAAGQGVLTATAFEEGLSPLNIHAEPTGLRKAQLRIGSAVVRHAAV